MHRRQLFLVWIPIGATGCGATAAPQASPTSPTPSRAPRTPTPRVATAKRSVDPASYPAAALEWGERVTGVRTRLATRNRVLALTFDACGGPNGSGYDGALISFLRAASVPATIFVNRRWIEANIELFLDLAADPLFEIANHGTEHRPLSVTGREVYGIAGTKSPADVIAEVRDNQDFIERLTGAAPSFFRSGTAYYDEVGVRIANDLGLEVVGFGILGDAGATLSANQVANQLHRAGPGSIALLHMNQPASGTAEGVRAAVPALRAQGYSFVRLSEHELAR